MHANGLLCRWKIKNLRFLVSTGLTLVYFFQKYLQKPGFLCMYVTLIPRWHMDYLEIMLLSYLQLKGKKRLKLMGHWVFSSENLST